MQDILAESLKRLKHNRVRRMRMITMLLVLSLIVSLDVFWVLRQPGLTLAGDADCRITEHTHDDICQNGETICDLTEHVHTIACYSDQGADIETQLNWQKMFANYPYTENLRENLVGIAKTQVGYSESTLNFEVGSDGIRRGYTRYGAWYGAPYNDWSAIFVSFCLHYAGADPNEFPGNTGAASMAKLWKNREKYIDTGQYAPVSGDLVFFTDNTVGIVAEVFNASFYAIRGDVDNAVQGTLLTLTDPTIVGWGITETTKQDDGAPPDTGQTESDPLDISNGPVFNIYINGEAPPPMRRFMLRSTPQIIDLREYLKENKGSYFFTLLNKQNEELPKDDQGNYIVQAGTGYKLTISFTSPEGFHPGIYEYQVPNGLMVDGGTGVFILNGEEVGTWSVTDTGLITLTFNEDITSNTDITISAALGIHFPEQNEPIDFDGKISVVVQKPPPQLYPTVVYKNGEQGHEGSDRGKDPTKIYWQIYIGGDKDSQIPGSILHDKIYLGPWSETHRYTASDIEGGLLFTLDGTDHYWHVSADDPHLVWEEFEWSYKIPKTVVCEHCGELELGNAGWYYYVYFTSTPDRLSTVGSNGYENEVTVDGAYGYAWVDFTQTEIKGTIHKTGAFVSDASGGAFLWEIQATLPGRPVDTVAQGSWYIKDEMNIYDTAYNAVGRAPNDAHLATVYVTYRGNTFQIPRIQDATDDDLFAWDIGWSTTENGITYDQVYYVLHRCECNEDTCVWGEACDHYWFHYADGTAAQKNFCQCWTITEDTTFTFVYETKDLSIIEKYGGLGYKLRNLASLHIVPVGANSARVDYKVADVPIPGLFKKELSHEFDKHTAAYTITVNEAKLVLTDGSPLVIHDEMTDTLAFISGSLVITTEDAYGNTATLQQGVDFEITYDGSGTKIGASGKPVHTLDIVINNPQPVKYILDYDATLIYPEQVEGGIKYGNSASITLWGQQIKDNSAEKVYADINIAAKSYKIDLYKTALETGDPLQGAIFGLYNAQGGLITTATTDKNGYLQFKTNVVKGIILREHELYYVQEIRAPSGYKLDDAKHWFCFCDKKTGTCTICNGLIAVENATRIPLDQNGRVQVSNEVATYQLPATGGPGIYPIILVSVTFIITPLVYMFILRRKRERRGVG